MSEETTRSMQIWVDADACPVAAREMLCRAAVRCKIQIAFIANQPIPLPRSPFIVQRQVSSGFDVADDFIVQECGLGDLVITSDIPLAAEVVEKGALALNTRGELYTKNNVKARLNMRDFMETMRSSGIHSGGAPPYGATDKQNFANQLDRWLAKVFWIVVLRLSFVIIWPKKSYSGHLLGLIGLEWG